MAKKPVEKQEVETTGHEWDGIQEYNNPLPRWWLWTTYACIIWGIGYVIAYPAIPLPGGATPGLLGYSSRGEVAADIAAIDAMNAPLVARINELELSEIASDELVGGEADGFAYNGGQAVFQTFCAQCHGAGASGLVGYPSLIDDDWIWGGTIEDIHTTISYGIRYEENLDTRISEMPAFGEFLSKEEIGDIVQYVGSLSGINDAVATEENEMLFLDNCAACHMDDGTGDRFVGAPNLTDFIWLYGSDVETLTHTVTFARGGVMPAWEGRLSESQIRQAAVYIHSLGGGE
ncbi:MAG TPA: cytochrome-c oxidase, cbb3-type subunit III [Rhodobacteraceae bacterium]|nr:cytochrome-c oxidase, cbb3-type subunit III [Paracoccaceae bacterium]